MEEGYHYRCVIVDASGRHTHTHTPIFHLSFSLDRRPSMAIGFWFNREKQLDEMDPSFYFGCFGENENELAPDSIPHAFRSYFLINNLENRKRKNPKCNADVVWLFTPEGHAAGPVNHHQHTHYFLCMMQCFNLFLTKRNLPSDNYLTCCLVFYENNWRTFLFLLISLKFDLKRTFQTF